MSSFVYLRPWAASRETDVTPSSVLRRIPPHQPSPPRPFWHRLLPRNRPQRARRRGAATAVSEADEEVGGVVFESTIIGEPPELAEEESQPPPLKRGLFRLSASLPSMSRRHQSRQMLKDVMKSPDSEEEEKEQETESRQQQRPKDISSSSSSFIQVFSASQAQSPTAATPSRPATTSSTRRPISSENPELSFRLDMDVEPAITALGPSYAGRILRRTSEHICVQEAVANRLTVASYIGKLDGWYTEIESREIFRGMCQIVQTLHKKHTVHRNLHLNQFLVHPSTGEFSVRGMFDAAHLESYALECGPYTEKPIVPDHKHKRRYDWFAFRSPELDTYEVSPRHGTPTDVWSMGVCLYTLLTGIPPFRGSGRSLRHSKMTAQTAPYEITTPSGSAQDLVGRMIVVNPTCRLTIAEVLAHPWMQDSFATDVDLSLTQTLFMDWDNRSARRRKRRHSARRHQASTSSLIAVGGGSRL